MKRILMITLIVIGISISIFGITYWQQQAQTASAPTMNAQPASAQGGYLYYTLKNASGFILARAPKGADGQPMGTPHPLVALGNGFGQLTSDAVVSLQLSPDGNYLEIDGERDHGEQVWMYNTQQNTITNQPPNVIGNFLHWLPGGNGHTFLYRPMFPMGPDAPMDGNTWNPGLWLVDASTGQHQNRDIGVPSADLVDAAPSPDGSHIVFSISTGLGQGSVTYMMNTDGSNIHKILQASGTQSVVGLFAWSPDGSQIAYERLNDGPTPFLPAGLWTMDSQGKAQQQISTVDGGHGYAPAWSPDGQKLAFIVRTNTTDHLADVDTQQLQCAMNVFDLSMRHTILTASIAQTGQALNLNPVWTADSRSVTFIALNAANRVTGGTPRYWLAHLPDLQGEGSITPISPTIPHVVAFG